MDEINDIVLVGLSQRTAPVPVRELYSVEAEGATEHVRALAATDGVSEAFLLSTCNRTEVLLVAADGVHGERAARETVFPAIDESHSYTFRGVHAIMHLFRVASGLDSMVIGETEILGQIKRGLAISQGCGSAGRFLQPLLTQSLVVGKRARAETAIGDGSLSVARVGLSVAARALGRYDDRDAVVIGAGETGLLAARYLSSEGVRRIAILNRTIERAQSAIAELGSHCEAYGLERMGAEMERADVAVVCVDGTHPLVTPDTFDRRKLARRDQPLVVLDLSVPRAVDPKVAEMDGVIVYDLDALTPIIDENRAERDAAADEVASILVGEVHKYLSLRTFAKFSPAIAEMKISFQSEREALIDRVTGGHATARELELAHALEKNLLALALTQLKHSARRSRSEEALDREYRRFLEGID